MGYITYKTSDGAPTGSEQKFRGVEKKEFFRVEGTQVVTDVITAVKNEFGSVTLKNIQQKLRTEAALSDENKTIPSLTGSGAFTQSEVQVVEKFKPHTKGDITFGTPTKTAVAIASTVNAVEQETVKKEKEKKFKK